MAVISIIQSPPTKQSSNSTAMKSTNETTALDKLTLTAVISCFCSVCYFLATSLLA